MPYLLGPDYSWFCACTLKLQYVKCVCTGCPTFLDWLTVDSVAGSETIVCAVYCALHALPSCTGLKLILWLHSKTIICVVYCALDALPSWTGLQLTLWLHSETIVCKVNCPPRKTFPYSLYPQEYIHILSSACSCCGYWLKAFVTFCAVNGQFFKPFKF